MTPREEARIYIDLIPMDKATKGKLRTQLGMQNSDSNNLRAIESGPSDIERAEQYRDDIGALLAKIADKMTEAKRHGLTVSFAIGTADAFGRFQIASLEISKKLA